MNFDIARTLGEALTLHQAGRAEEAERLYRQILAVDPDNVHTLHLLGVAAYHTGRNVEARELIARAIAFDGGFADFHCNMALVQYALGHPEQAEWHCRRAINLDPGHAETHNNFGNALTEQARLEEAEGHLRQAIAMRPGYAEAHFNLANALRRLDRNDDAIEHYREAVALRPNFASAHYNLGHALSEEGELLEAERQYRRAIGLAPDRTEFHNNLGVTLHQLDRLPEAEACYRHVLALCPDHAVALDNLATVQRITCRTVEAIASLRQAIEISPESHVFQTNLIFALNFDPTASPEDHQTERARFDVQHARQFAAAIRPHGNEPDPQRRLRIGYVSGHFCHQAATFAFAGVILNHDPEHFEVICYSDTAKEDAITQRLRARADRWHRTEKLSDEELARLVRSDGVDILVDLVGHMGGHRLLVFARKPAPVQVTAWGEPTGTGLKTMDYLLADPILVPANERALLTEKVVDLPNFLGFWVRKLCPIPGRCRRLREVSSLSAHSTGSTRCRSL